MYDVRWMEEGVRRKDGQRRGKREDKITKTKKQNNKNNKQKY